MSEQRIRRPDPFLAPYSSSSHLLTSSSSPQQQSVAQPISGHLIDGNIISNSRIIGDEAAGSGREQKAPLHPRFSRLEDRLKSFDDPQWPSNCPVTPADLSGAGFYYYGSFEGIRDSVKCFHCDAGLCLWEKGDEPWTEHMRVAPACDFVLQFHPDIVRKRRLKDQWLKRESARDVNEVINDWMTGLMIAQFQSEHRVSRNVLRNALYERWLQTKTPFHSMEGLQKAVAAVSDHLNRRYNHMPAVDWKASQRSSESSTGCWQESECLSDDDSGMGSSQESDCCSSLSSQSSQSSQSSGREGHSSRMLCKVCLDKGLEVVFMPCGHFVSCSGCSENLKTCPCCRKVIASAIRSYMN